MKPSFRGKIHHRQHRTVTQLAKDAVEEGRSAILLKVDLEKAYDRLKRSAIIHHMRAFPLTYQKWISAYLSNRRAAATVAGHVSEFYDVEEGVPQGTVLSPLRFEVMENLAKTLECVDRHVCMHADYLVVNFTQCASESQMKTTQRTS